MRRRRAALLMAAAAWSLALVPHADPAVRSAFVQTQPSGRLDIESDGADAIGVVCTAERVLVNGAPPDTGPLDCSRVNQVAVVGGPGDNRIDLSAFSPRDHGLSKGVGASSRIDGRAGDDIILGPRYGYVSLIGGPGSDWLQGQAATIDRYVFMPATTSERDTVIEPATAGCAPTYFGIAQPSRTWWSLPWDSLDFASLAADDPLTVDEHAPGGTLASHRNRVVTSTRSAGIAFEAISGGAGDDRITGGCMDVGLDGDDVLTGTADSDLVLGGRGDDRLAGGPAGDRLDGGPGRDRLDGGAGADALVGASGSDTLLGSGGSDVYLYNESDGLQTETVLDTGASDLDVLSFDFGRRSRVVVDLSARSGLVARAPGLALRTGPDLARRFEGIIGGSGADVLVGNNGANHFWGGGGADLAVGRSGNDTYHGDWVGSMPWGAYAWNVFWDGPFARELEAGRLAQPGARRSVMRILELARGGFDTLDLSERWIGGRLEGQIRDGARVDLSAPRRIVHARKVDVFAARSHGTRFLEGVRGTTSSDEIIGNSANNVLEGRQGRDRIVGGRGRDLCLTERDRDVLRGCERTRRANPNR